MEYIIVMPVKNSDLHLVETNYRRLKKYVNAKEIVVITNTKDCEYLAMLNEEIKIIDENTMYKGMSFEAVKNEMINTGLDPSYTGHCFQQLLKMAYCYLCPDDGYLVWDADTIPTRPVLFYDENLKKYIFHMKNEFVQTYFDHMFKLLNIKKQEKRSFISEHMYFEKRIMEEIISLISENKNVDGDNWWKKVVHAMACGNGMSEYEMYGNFTLYKYPEEYIMKDSLSLRFGRNVLGTVPTEKQIEWMSKKYDAVSIENFDEETFLTKLSSSEWIMKHVNPKFYADFVSVINRGINRISREIHKM